MAIKKHDFIELEYTGKIKDSDEIFDTTDEKTAKEAEIFNEAMKFGPVTICVGEGQLVKGLDSQLEGKEIGSHKIEVKAEDAFGKKSAKLVQLISTNKFLKENIQPQPGLQVNIDGAMGIIKTVSGGRTMVDFNHPLSSRDLVYEIKINKLITDNKDKIAAYIDINMNMKPEIEIAENKATIKLKQDVPKEISETIITKLKELVPEVKEYKFEKKVDEKPKAVEDKKPADKEDKKAL